METWIWTATILGILLAIGGWTDWKRRHSGGGRGPTPTEARRDAVARSFVHSPHS